MRIKAFLLETDNDIIGGGKGLPLWRMFNAQTWHKYNGIGAGSSIAIQTCAHAHVTAVIAGASHLHFSTFGNWQTTHARMHQYKCVVTQCARWGGGGGFQG